MCSVYIGSSKEYNREPYFFLTMEWWVLASPPPRVWKSPSHLYFSLSYLSTKKNSLSLNFHRHCFHLKDSSSILIEMKSFATSFASIFFHVSRRSRIYLCIAFGRDRKVTPWKKKRNNKKIEEKRGFSRCIYDLFFPSYCVCVIVAFVWKRFVEVFESSHVQQYGYRKRSKWYLFVKSIF